MKTHYSCAELAALSLPGFPATERAWRDVVERDAWAFKEIKSRGRNGLRREYCPPERVSNLISMRTAIQSSGEKARHALELGAKLRAQAEAERNAKTSAAFDDLWAQLSDKGRSKFDARFEIVLAWRNFFAQRQPMKRNESFTAFAAAYNARHLPGITEAMRAGYGTISPRSIQRWVLENEDKGLVVMADRRAMKGGGVSTVEQHPELEKLIVYTLTERPHANHTAVLDLINAARIDKSTGEILWPELSYSALNRYINKWKEQNAQAHMLNTNPDAWKSKYLSSLGKLDGDIVRINQRWEMDGTPADWMLRGGRHTASVTVDVWSRRAKILFSKTARTETNKALLRKAVGDWGVPEVAKTDNGSDYVSREMNLFFEEAGIDGVQSNKFAPWEKAHVESFIKTYLHSLLELLGNFVGHNVAERKAIEARKSFAENLFKKGAVVEIDMTVEELQELTDAWLEGTYHTRDHSSLGMSPREKAASWMGPVRRVNNERALDLLLWKPAKRQPKITSQGIRYDGATFIHECLPLHAGKYADIRLDPVDLGRIVVFVDDKFLCIASDPNRTGINRAELAAKARAVQRQWAADERKAARDRKKGMPSIDDMVKDIIRDRAIEARKVALMPKPATAHDTPALREAAKAAAKLDGRMGSAGRDAGIVIVEQVPEAIATRLPEASRKVGVIPETPELRWRKHQELSARFERGEDIAELANEQVRRWLTTYPLSPEGRAMARKYAAPMEKTKPAATGLASLIR